MTFQQIIDQINQKIFQPVYFLEGEESFFIDQIVNLLEENVLQENEKAFNLSIFYGKDTDPLSVIQAARRYPMGADRQLVLLKEAQSLNKIETLQKYIEKPLKQTVLVIAYKYGKVDGRTQFANVLKKSSVYFEAKKLYEDKIPEWIVTYTHSKGYKIDFISSQLLTDYLGNDLGRISQALEKLFLNLKKGKTITKESIETGVGIRRDYNVFELGSAIGSRDYKKVFKIIFYFCENPKENPLVVIIGFLGTFFSKVLSYHYLKGLERGLQASKLGVNPFFLSQYETASKNYPPNTIPAIISYIRIADMQSKGVDIGPNTSNADILKELVFNIIHVEAQPLVS